MKKTIYEAPSVEQINVKVEDNFLATGGSAVRALGNSSVEESEEYNSGNAIAW